MNWITRGSHVDLRVISHTNGLRFENVQRVARPSGRLFEARVFGVRDHQLFEQTHRAYLNQAIRSALKSRRATCAAS